MTPEELKKLREKAAKLLADLTTMNDAAKAEKRGLSDEENAKYDAILAEFNDIKGQIERGEKYIKAQQYMGEVLKEGVRDVQGENQNTQDESKKVFRSAFWKAQTKQPLTTEESRSLNTATDAKGGYLVPETFSSTIIAKAAEKSYIRDLATVTTSTSVENIPVEGDDGENGWIDEEGAYPESDPTISQVQLSAWKTGRIVKVTDEALNDTIPAIEGYIAMKFVKSTIKAEEPAFISGDGVKKPTGILLTADVGKTTASSTGITADEIIDLMTSLDEDYEMNAYLMMNKNTRAAIRKLKDNNGQYLWAPGLGGNPDTFDGKPIRINKHMPDIAAGAKPIAYGDFSYYHIKDRTIMTMKRLDEKYADTGHVGFRIDKRVDGKLVLAEAVKTLQIAAS